MSEARALAEDRLREMAALPLEELLRFEGQPVKEEISGPSGETYLRRTGSFWDMDPYDSDLFVQVSVRGRGFHWWQRYGGTHLRGPEDDFAPAPAEEPGVSSAWVQNFSCLGLAIVVLGLPLSAIYWVIRRLL